MYGFKILCKILDGNFEIKHKILNPYAAKYVFHEVLKFWRIMISSSYGILSLDETCSRCHQTFHTHIKLFRPNQTAEVISDCPKL